MGGQLQLIKHINAKINFFQKLNNEFSKKYDLLRQYYLSLPKGEKRISVREEGLEILQFQKFVLQEWEKVIEIKKSLLNEQETLLVICSNFY
jgi:hypothetical protein